MGTPETSREPCPDRILDDAGGAFAMGLGGGTLYSLFRGATNFPRGEKLSGAFQSVRMNAPKTGGGFAVWGALFSTFDCGMVYVRQKEDPWNSILAGAATGGLLQLRHGVRPVAHAAAFGAALLAMIEGVGIMVNRSSLIMPPASELAYQDPSLVGTQTGGWFGGLFAGGNNKEDVDVVGGGSGSESGGWFRGLFGGGKNEVDNGSGSGGSETKVLETYDTLPPSLPTFDFK